MMLRGGLQLWPGTEVATKSPPGFATLATKQVTGEVRSAGVAVFGRPSGKESLIVKIAVSAVPHETPIARLAGPSPRLGKARYYIPD